MKKMVLLVLIISLTSFLVAEWNTDPFINLNISNNQSGCVIPKVVQTDNGTSYYTWFQANSGMYNVRMQKVDPNGNLLWGENGILISDHESMTWLTDYEITIDSEENVIITFQDIRTSNNDVFLYKISPGAEFLFGEDGINVSNSDLDEMSPTVEVNSNDDIFVGYMSDSMMTIKTFNSSGEELASLEFSETDLSYSWPQFLKVENGNLIAKYYEDSGPAWSPIRKVYAQKYNSNLVPQWDNIAVISNAGGISAWTQKLSIKKDYEDGFYITWHDNRQNLNIADSYLQHVSSTGEILLPENGLLLSDNSSFNQFLPKVTATELGAYIFWSEQDGDQNLRGIRAQYVEAGQLNWGSTGIEILALGSMDPQTITAQKINNAFICFFSRTTDNNDEIVAVKLNKQGEYVWEEMEKILSSAATGKLHFDYSDLKNNQWLLTWETSEPAEIFAQNFIPDTNVAANDIPEINSVELSQNYPNPFIANTSRSYKNTVIDFSINSDSVVDLSIFNLKGQKIKSLTNSYYNSGKHSIKWNGKDKDEIPVKSGMYFYRLKTKNKTLTKKLILVK